MSDSDDVLVCDKSIKPQFRLVSREENLEHWSDKIADLARRCKATIHSHWMYDYRRETFLCELTPSYDLNFIQYHVRFDDYETKDTPEGEELLDLVDTADGDLGEYAHCSEINSIPFPTPDHCLYRDYVNPLYYEETQQSYASLLEEDLEYLRCNGGVWAGHYNLVTSKTLYGEEFLERATNELSV